MGKTYFKIKLSFQEVEDRRGKKRQERFFTLARRVSLKDEANNLVKGGF